MRQLVLTGTRRLVVENSRPRPLLPAEARVAVHACGICGSDVNGYAGINEGVADQRNLPRADHRISPGLSTRIGPL